MKDLWKTLRLAGYVFALPLLATAAVSAHQFFQNDDPVQIVVTPKTDVEETQLVGLNDTYRQHTVSLNDDGKVTGTVWIVDAAENAKAGLADSKVFFLRDGQIAQQVYADADGTFEVSGLTTGAYSFVVTNVEGMAVYGVNIVEDGHNESMDAVIVSRNSDQAQKLLKQENTADQSESLTREVVRGSNVATMINGELEGRLFSTWQDADFTGSTVKIYNQSNEVVGQADTDADGNFVVTDLETGFYEFVATGPQGYAAFGFEAVDSNSSYTSTTQQVFDAMVTSPSDGYYVNDCATCGGGEFFSSPVEYAGGCSTCSGAFGACGGGCGGCGGFGGIGGGFGGAGGIAGRLLGSGRLLGLAGLIVGIVNLADDDDDGPGPITPMN